MQNLITNSEVNVLMVHITYTVYWKIHSSRTPEEFTSNLCQNLVKWWHWVSLSEICLYACDCVYECSHPHMCSHPHSPRALEALVNIHNGPVTC